MRWQRRVSGATSSALSLVRERWPRPGLRIVLYHAVGSHVPGDTYGMSVRPAALAEQLDALTALAPVVEVDASPRRDALETAITFDDGFADVLDVAAPLLTARGMPARVFVTAELIDRPGYLSPAGVRELASVPGITIGAHGASHRLLTRLDDAELARDLDESRAVLEDLLGTSIDSMAYPNGAVDARVQRAVATAGFTLAASSRWRINTPSTDRLRLGRVEVVESDDRRAFVQKVVGAWDWLGVRPDPT